MSENEQNDSYNDVYAYNGGIADKFFLKISKIYARSGISYGNINRVTVRTQN